VPGLQVGEHPPRRGSPPASTTRQTACWACSAP